jgi:hypothetical protein
MNMKKRIISLLLLFVFLALIVQGCTNKGRDASKENNDITGGNGKHASGDAAGKVSAKDSEQAMGRYIESKAKLPEMSQGEIILGILMNPDGYFEVYTMHKGRYYCYRQNKDDLWESNMPGWLNNDTVKKADVITNIQQGGDGNYYACLESYTNKESRCRIVQSADGGNTVQTVDMPYLNKAESETAEYTLYPRIQQMGVMENGTYVFNDVGDPDILMLYSPEGDKLDELEIDYRQNFLVTGNKLIAAGKDETGILFYDGDSMTVEKTIAYTLDNRALTFALKEDNTLLVVDSDGIHRMSGDGTLWEIVVDGILNSMSMPSLTPYSLYVTEGEHEEYHVVYKDANEGTYSLMHYRFDKNVSSVPSREITVYSLRENKTIRQAIAMFQAQNEMSAALTVSLTIWHAQIYPIPALLLIVSFF